MGKKNINDFGVTFSFSLPIIEDVKEFNYTNNVQKLQNRSKF
jgi:hypothetical protein